MNFLKLFGGAATAGLLSSVFFVGQAEAVTFSLLSSDAAPTVGDIFTVDVLVSDVDTPPLFFADFDILFDISALSFIPGNSFINPGITVSDPIVEGAPGDINIVAGDFGDPFPETSLGSNEFLIATLEFLTLTDGLTEIAFDTTPQLSFVVDGSFLGFDTTGNIIDFGVVTGSFTPTINTASVDIQPVGPGPGPGPGTGVPEPTTVVGSALALLAAGATKRKLKKSAN